MTRQAYCLILSAGLFLCAATLCAQDVGVASDGQAAAPTPAAADDTATLAKATQNPVASLISVPLQNNSNFAVGPYNRTQNVFNIQPVIPSPLSENWTLITRIIQPLVWQPYADQVTGGQFGFGDMNPTFFLSPAKPGKLIWGAGPAMVFPTATSAVLGQGKLSFGPSVVALIQPKQWTIGVLVNNVWSVAGSTHRPHVNQETLQYFINYNLNKGWYLTSAPIVTANWNNKASGDAADGDDNPPGGRWALPFGGGAGRIMRLGFQPVNISASFYGNAVHPPGASSWGMRLQIALLYPRMPPKK
ncbi:MAG: neuromedin U [Edaphobacter sp.]